MTAFQPLTVESRESIENYLKNSDTHLAELNFTTIFTWNHAFNASWAVINGGLVIRMDFSKERGPVFTMPVGTDDFKPIFEELYKISEEAGAPFSVRSVEEWQLPLIEEAFPDMFDVSLRESYSDYIYSAEKLATLAGKKLHGKRNHINRFESAGEWHTEIVTAEKLDLCRKFAEAWFAYNTEEKDMVYDSEVTSLDVLFDNFEKLSVEGMMLYQGEHLVAITFGEVMSKETALIHYEKADSNIQGAYPMINREFARYITEKYPHIKYINREEDMGIEGLRKAKRSYYPEFMGHKYIVTLKEGAKLL